MNHPSLPSILFGILFYFKYIKILDHGIVQDSDGSYNFFAWMKRQISTQADLYRQQQEVPGLPGRSQRTLGTFPAMSYAQVPLSSHLESRLEACTEVLRTSPGTSHSTP